jgi:two-component system CheB/CheR fusion protein
MPIRLRGVDWTRDGQPIKYLDIEFMPVRDRADVIAAVAVAFVDVTRYRRLQDELEHTHSELESAHEDALVHQRGARDH